jgi:hypothetical protein
LKNRAKWAIPTLISGYALVLLFFVSKNSPLYLNNNWVDLNVFFTIGRGWVHGLLPYRDLFDQKGPLLYAVYAIAAMISNHYWSILIVEWISFSLSLYLLYRIARLRLQRNMSLMFVALSSVVLTWSPYFSAGGSAEELMFPSILWLIYRVMMIDSGNRITWKATYISGLMIGWIFWVKYTAVGAWIGFCLVMVVALVWQHNWRGLRRSIGGWLAGWLTWTIPIFMYFWWQQGLKQMLFAYFVANVKYYPAGQNLTMVARLITGVTKYFTQLSNAPILFGLATLGLLVVILDRQVVKSKLGLYLMVASNFCLIALTLSGRSNLSYYWLILLPFLCVPMLSILVRVHTQPHWGVMPLIGAVAFVFVLTSNTNIKESRLFPYNPSVDASLKSDVPAQARFASIIKHSTQPHTLLNYNVLDAGVYQAANITPQNRFFFKANLPQDRFPAMMNQQNNIVKHEQVTFVVTGYYAYQNPKTAIPTVLKQHYHEVAQQKQVTNGTMFTLMLFECNTAADSSAS